ncbi:porin [Clostridiales bacterium PH28_bin88]|nr:porin [Clostridiales bacterium PH28_bin88]
MLVFIGAGSAVVTLLLSQGEKFASNFNIGIGALGGLGDWLAIGMAFGIAVTAAIYIFGPISGCHINPAVTVALWATKRFPTRELVPYIVAQLAGASLGALTLVAILGSRAATVGGLGATAPFPGVSDGQAVIAEAAGTFILMLTIMGVAVSKKAPPGWAGLIIGLIVAGVITTTANFAGSSLNPARTFGPYLIDFLVGGPSLWAKYWIYIIGPILGSVAAAFVYDYVAEEKSES